MSSLSAVSLETAAAGDSGDTFRDKIGPSVRGVSLVELLVTIAVLGVLAAIAIPSYTGLRESSAQSVARRNMDLLNGAVTAYNQSNRNIAEALGSDANEASVIAAMQAYDVSNPTPGAPYLSPSMPCPVTSSPDTYRAQWNGNFFQFVPKGSPGSGIDLGALAGSVP